MDQAGLGCRIRGMNQAGGVGIANGRLQVLERMGHDCLDLLPETLVLGADLGSQRAKRTAQHTTMLGVEFCLLSKLELAVIPDALQWWHRSGEDRIRSE